MAMADGFSFTLRLSPIPSNAVTGRVMMRKIWRGSSSPSWCISFFMMFAPPNCDAHWWGCPHQPARGVGGLQLPQVVQGLVHHADGGPEFPLGVIPHVVLDLALGEEPDGLLLDADLIAGRQETVTATEDHVVTNVIPRTGDAA